MRTRTIALLAALLALAATAWAEPPRHDFPTVGRYQVLVGDFHMHTVNSDGKFTTRERVQESYDLGYDVIAITDHGKHKAYRVAKFVGEPLGLVVIRGIETGINRMEHLVGIGVPPDYVPRDSHNWAENPGENRAYYQDQMKEVTRGGGLLIYPHPHKGMREHMLWGIKQGYVQGIEVKNGVVGEGWATVKFEGADCYPFAFDWALEHNLALFANTDVHGGRSTKSFTGTLVFATDKTDAAVMDALRSRRTAAWFNEMLWGREGLLADLVTASVSATRSADGSVLLENRCPIALKGAVGDRKFDLGAYQKAAVDAGGSQTITVQWNNIWTSPKTNLSTTLAVR